MTYYGYDAPDLIEVDDKARILGTNEIGVVIDLNGEGDCVVLVGDDERGLFEDQIERI